MLSRRQFALATAAVGAAPRSAVANKVGSASPPRRSDICFSPRFGERSAANWLGIARAFHATRIDWTYGSEAFIAEARRNGFPCTSALSPLVGDPSDQSDRLRTKDGGLVITPWQLWPGAYWGCFNNESFRQRFRLAAMKRLAAGATGIQVDDAAGNYAATGWGACWCDACRKKADDRGVDLSRQMKSFQRDSTQEFFEWLFTTLPHGITTSNNNAGLTLDTPTGLFDFSIGEISPVHLQPDFLYRSFKALDAAGRRQVVTLRSNDLAANRRAIALVYAFGGLMVAPWDVYIRSTPTGSDRFFGRPEDFEDLYALIKTHAGWFDDFELVSIASGQLSFRPDLLQTSAPGVVAVLRRAADRRLVLHLIVPPGHAGGTVVVRTDLQSAALAKAAGSRPLAATSELGRLKIEVPRADPWAVVLIS